MAELTHVVKISGEQAKKLEQRAHEMNLSFQDTANLVLRAHFGLGGV